MLARTDQKAAPGQPRPSGPTIEPAGGTHPPEVHVEVSGQPAAEVEKKNIRMTVAHSIMVTHPDAVVDLWRETGDDLLIFVEAPHTGFAADNADVCGPLECTCSLPWA